MIENGTAMLNPNWWVMIDNRVDRVQFARPHLMMYESWALSKPGLRPPWQSLQYPFTPTVRREWVRGSRMQSQNQLGMMDLKIKKRNEGY